MNNITIFDKTLNEVYTHKYYTYYYNEINNTEYEINIYNQEFQIDHTYNRVNSNIKVDDKFNFMILVTEHNKTTDKTIKYLIESLRISKLKNAELLLSINNNSITETPTYKEIIFDDTKYNKFNISYILYYSNSYTVHNKQVELQFIDKNSSIKNILIETIKYIINDNYNISITNSNITKYIHNISKKDDMYCLPVDIITNNYRKYKYTNKNINIIKNTINKIIQYAFNKDIITNTNNYSNSDINLIYNINLNTINDNNKISLIDLYNPHIIDYINKNLLYTKKTIKKIIQAITTNILYNISYISQHIYNLLNKKNPECIQINKQLIDNLKDTEFKNDMKIKAITNNIKEIEEYIINNIHIYDQNIKLYKNHTSEFYYNSIKFITNIYKNYIIHLINNNDKYSYKYITDILRNINNIKSNVLMSVYDTAINYILKNNK